TRWPRDWSSDVCSSDLCKHVTSNAIVIGKGLQTIGIGGGQTSRVDSVKIAIEKAREHGHDLAGAALASDAFFPFADGPQAAIDRSEERRVGKECRSRRS